MGTLNIEMLGTSFAIKANEEDEYLEKLLGYYKQITQEIENGGGLKEPVKIAIMSGIMLCDELYKEKTKVAKAISGAHGALPEETDDTAEVERLALEMIEKIDKALQ